MRKLLLLLLALPLWACNSINESRAYIITTNFVEQEYGYAFNDIDCPFTDYQFDNLKNDTYLIVSHFDYKDDVGVTRKFKYKAKVQYLGSGDWSNKDNWQLHYIEPYNN